MGEPLYLDILRAFAEKENPPKVIGGRYGLGSKDPNPSDIAAVYENLAKESFGFTISIDDITNNSLEPIKEVDATTEGTTACKFWGLGSDGKLEQIKVLLKLLEIIQNMYAQGYFSLIQENLEE